MAERISPASSLADARRAIASSEESGMLLCFTFAHDLVDESLDFTSVAEVEATAGGFS